MKIAMMTTIACTLAVPVWGAENIQLRLTHEKPGEKSDRMEIVHGDPNAPLKEVVFVDQKALVDQTEVKSAQLEASHDGTPCVELLLTDSGAHALRHDFGRHVALVVDGQALVAGELTRANETEKIDLLGDFTKGEAQRAVDRINQSAAH